MVYFRESSRGMIKCRKEMSCWFDHGTDTAFSGFRETGLDRHYRRERARDRAGRMPALPGSGLVTPYRTGYNKEAVLRSRIIGRRRTYGKEQVHVRTHSDRSLVDRRRSHRRRPRAQPRRCRRWPSPVSHRAPTSHPSSTRPDAPPGRIDCNVPRPPEEPIPRPQSLRALSDPRCVASWRRSACLIAARRRVRRTPAVRPVGVFRACVETSSLNDRATRPRGGATGSRGPRQE